MSSASSATLDELTSCALRTSKAQLGEDLVLLPTLLAHARKSGKPGRFVEIGAFTGIALSNTYMLEKCFGWSGLLIEASPHNFAQLRTAGRQAKIVNSGVCEEPGVIRMTTRGGPTAGQFGAMSAKYLQLWGGRNGANSNQMVEVPCKPMRELMSDAGIHHAHFLSLDVEGAEDKVFDTARPTAFGVVMAEADNYDPPKDERVKQRALRGGLRLSTRALVRASNVFLRSDVDESVLTPIPKDYLPLNGFKIFRYNPTHRVLRAEIAHALNRTA